MFEKAHTKDIHSVEFNISETQIATGLLSIFQELQMEKLKFGAQIRDN